MKVTRHKKDGGCYVRIPKEFATKLGISGGYVNVYLCDGKLIIEKTFKEDGG